jgi:LysR family transcriptional regulator, benzoate and cis,cis-muconate-responsive activator of ben and cat genes
MEVGVRHLRAIVAIADDGTHTAEAATLHLAQPTLTRTAHELEHVVSLRLAESGTAQSAA